jgi:hypothetical protein
MATFDPVKVCEDLATIQDKILDIVDELEEIQQTADASSGKIKQLIPQNLMIAMDKLTAIVDNDSPDSLSSITELIQNMPLKDLADQKKQKRSELRKQAQQTKDEVGEEFEDSDLIPEEGPPKSEIMGESANPLSAFVKGKMGQRRLDEMKIGGLSFNTLKEAGLGETLDADVMSAFGASAGKSALLPSSAIPSGGRIREKINAKYAVEGEGLEESGERLADVNIMKFKNPGASIGMPGLSLSEMSTNE